MNTPRRKAERAPSKVSPAAPADPVRMLHEFVRQHRRGEPVAEDVAAWLAARFAEYLFGQGVTEGAGGPIVLGIRSKRDQRTLDEVMGLQSGVPSARSPLTRRMLTVRDRVYRIRCAEAIALGYQGAGLARVVMDTVEPWLVANGYPLRTAATLANQLVKWRREPEFAALVGELSLWIAGKHPTAPAPWDGPIMLRFGPALPASAAPKKSRERRR